MIESMPKRVAECIKAKAARLSRNKPCIKKFKCSKFSIHTVLLPKVVHNSGYKKILLSFAGNILLTVIPCWGTRALIPKVICEVHAQTLTPSMFDALHVQLLVLTCDTNKKTKATL
ncbi:hypothetical protein BpHYR1_037524 [Brachionus plicatilis]|uniref:Uncharacterized protein n=1 Tax=Brachionus plicatilis TaxID=10195 RepID=A0A3M7S0B4_BRAPC|nr:hypothetical protein BpHYR1_037524 [Brachionus plicatilis]